MNRFFIALLILTSFASISMAQTEPLNQPTNLQFVGIKAYGMSLAFTASDATKYLVLRSNQPISDIPTDNVFYASGNYIGNSKVVASGDFKSLYKIREALIHRTYYFAIFGYNQSGNNYNYKTNNPLSGSKATLDADVGTYYDNYRLDTEDAIDDLSDLLYNHYHLSYSDYDIKLINNIYQKDTTAGAHYVQCSYSNNIFQYTGSNFNFNVYNREHVTPKSWMPSDPTSYTFEGSDYHNLFPVKASVNSKRSNYPVGEVVNQTWSDLDSKFGKDQNNNNVFEPKEEIKGDVARAMFYQLITYDGLVGSWAFNNLESYGDNQDVELLYQWHLQDTVSDFERTRNEYIYSQQNNRNPFIDFPEWVNCIDFKTMTLNGTCPLDSTLNIAIFSQPNSNNEIVVYPNPLIEKGFVRLNNDEKILKVEWFSLNGHTDIFDYELTANIVNFSIKNKLKGIYFIKITTLQNTYIQKLNIE